MFLSLAALAVTPLVPTLAPESRVAIMRRRDADWRVGPVVYQVFVDRFAPSANVQAKAKLYAAPRRLRSWDQLPTGGTSVPKLGVWSHELDFWGGDLASLRAKLRHVASLSDVLYLNPIHEALTNHKYDATNWDRIAPEYGDWKAFEGLTADVHSRKMHLVLDGVFNHCGRSNPIFESALHEPTSPFRKWFTFSKAFPSGYKAWANVANLPEVHLESPAARDYLWRSSDSIVAKYLKAGADGWRLDVAHELGLPYLRELTDSAHKHRPGSLVVGEVWNYPSRWTSAMDGILDMFLGRVIIDYAQGRFTSAQVTTAVRDVIADCGIEPLMRSWTVLGNHDTPRLATVLPDRATRHFAQALQFTLPGAPVIYYGDEVGMTGGDDPAQRAPMRWDLVKPDNLDLAWVKTLVKLRKNNRALRIGECHVLNGERTFAYLRTTERPLEAVVVVANPSEVPVTESLVVRDPTLMGYTLMRDVITGEQLRVMAGTLNTTVPPKGVRVYVIDGEAKGRGQYKRMGEG